MFLNTAKDSICTCCHHLFNNCLDFTISSLLIHGPKSKIFYTDLVFYLYCQLWEIHSWGILSLFTPVYCESLSGCTFVLEWMLHNGSWVWLLCLRVGWKQPCSFQKQLWERICTVLSHSVRENGLSFKETSLRVGKLGMTLGIYFNLFWALLSSSVKRWTWNRRNLRSLPTLNILRLY